MATPASATTENLQMRVDTCVQRRDELISTLFPNGQITPEEQVVLDRIDSKLQQLQALAAQAGEARGGGSSISAPVGNGGRNVSQDVMTVQQLLNDSGASLAVDGLCGPKTIGAIDAYQQRTFGWKDSLVEPGRETITALTGGGASTTSAPSGETVEGGGGTSGTEGGTGEDAVEDGSVSGTSITAPVGKGGRNVSEDVMVVQQLLNDSGASLTVDGLCGPKTIAAIKSYQQRTFGWNDSLVEPGRETITALTGGGVTSGGDGTSSTTGSQGGDSLEDLPPPAPVPGIGLCPTDTNEPTTIEGNPNDPEVMDDLLAEQLEQLPDPETTVDIMDEYGEVLSFVEFPFLFNQEISIGLTIGGIGGTLKIKFNGEGQIDTVAVEIPAIPGKTLAASPYGILCKGEIKPLSCDFQIKKRSDAIQFDLEMSTSGSVMVGLGAARGENWAGLGVEVELKAARTKKLTASLAMEMLQNAIMGSSLASLALDFNLPAEIILSGSQSLVAGASGGNQEAAVSIGRKMTLKDYPKMVKVEISEDGVEVTPYDDLYRMLEDHARATFPLLDIAMEAYELGEEISEFIDDPDGYSERKRAEAEELLRRAQAFPGDMRNLIKRELDKLAKLDSEIARQLEEWTDDASNAIDDLVSGATDAIDGTAQEILEAADGLGDLVGGVADDLMDAADDALQSAEDRLDRAIERVERARALAETAAEAARDAVQNAGEIVIEEVLERAQAARDAAEDAVEAAQAAREAAESVADDVRAAAERRLQEAVQQAEAARDTAEEFARNAQQAIEEMADDVIDTVEGVTSEAARAAERALNEALERAEAATETAERMARAAREAAENAAETVVEDIEALAQSAREAAEEAARAVQEVRDAADGVADDVRRTAERAAEEALRRAQAAQETAESLARSVAQALADAAGNVQDAAEAIAGAAAAAAQRAVDEALARAEAAREVAENLAREARQAAESAAGNAVDEALERARAAREAVEDAARAAQAVRDAVGDAAQEVQETAERAVEDALRRAQAARETAEELARDAQRAANDAGEQIADAAEDVRDAAQDALNDIEDAAETAIEDAKKTADELAQAAQDVAREAQETAASAAEDILEGAEDALETAQELAENAADQALEGAADVLDDAAEGLGNLADRLRNPFGGR